MKRRFVILRVLLVAILVLTVNDGILHSWGFYAHQKINRMAVFTLPPEMIGFYKRHIEFVTEHAVDPDKRRYAVKGEAPHHFIDIDHFSKDEPFKVMPRKWKDAVAKFTEDSLLEYGVVPWWIDKVMYRLTRAFQEGDVDRILRYSADLGHYIGDAHVPLHTTENYNGHMTNQRGIHGFWESRLPELYSENYDFLVGRAEYIENPLDKAWEVVEASHAGLDSVLTFEADMNAEWAPDRKYAMEHRGQTLMKVYSQEYSKEYHMRLGGQVERRMRAAIYTVGSMWYTAWVNAGQPDLEPQFESEISPEFMEEMIEAEFEIKSSEGPKGRPHE
ncbi:MAG: hypothetical protein ACI85F_000182 [Bacteroidia bacterium]|jgi:hypothetical protein